MNSKVNDKRNTLEAVENEMYQNFTRGQGINSEEIQTMWHRAVVISRLFLKRKYRDEFEKLKDDAFTLPW